MAYPPNTRIKHTESGRLGTIIRESFTCAGYLIHWDDRPIATITSARLVEEEKRDA